MAVFQLSGQETITIIFDDNSRLIITDKNLVQKIKPLLNQPDKKAQLEKIAELLHTETMKIPD